MRAARHGKNSETVEVLLRAGARPERRDLRGRAAADHAENNPAIRKSPIFRQLRETKKI